MQRGSQKWLPFWQIAGQRWWLQAIDFKSERTCAAWRPLNAIAQLAYINLQFRKGAAQGIAVHAQLASGAALVAFILLEDSDYEPLFEFANRLGVENIALIHLHDQCFQLIFHGGALFLIDLSIVMNALVLPSCFRFPAAIVELACLGER